MNHIKRPTHFAHKFVRLTQKVCLAQEIGQGAVLLLCYVAHTQDAKHYTSPVTFFNEQLIPLLGLSGKRHLIAARNRAVESGWLEYEPGRKGIAGFCDR